MLGIYERLNIMNLKMGTEASGLSGLLCEMGVITMLKSEGKKWNLS